MKKYLQNLANTHAINKCKELNIDPSGTHIYKYPRKQTYSLVKDETGKAIITITFYTSHVPTYSINPNQYETHTNHRRRVRSSNTRHRTRKVGKKKKASTNLAF